MVQWVAHIKSHKHTDNSSDPGMHIECQAWWHSPATTVLGGGGTETTDPQISLDRQYSQLMSSKFSETLPLKIKAESEEDI